MVHVVSCCVCRQQHTHITWQRLHTHPVCQIAYQHLSNSRQARCSHLPADVLSARSTLATQDTLLFRMGRVSAWPVILAQPRVRLLYANMPHSTARAATFAGQAPSNIAANQVQSFCTTVHLRYNYMMYMLADSQPLGPGRAGNSHSFIVQAHIASMLCRTTRNAHMLQLIMMFDDDHHTMSHPSCVHKLYAHITRHFSST